MERREFLLSAGGIVGATAIGSVAYTSATVKRDVTLSVTSDESAIIGLSPGSHDAIDLIGGKLTIDTSIGPSSGLNRKATFRYGDANAPVGTYAFSITNNDNQVHDLTLELKNMSMPGDSSFRIKLYRSDGTTHIGDVSPTSSLTDTSWASGEVIYAIIIIETKDISSDKIEGTLEFTAT